ncbi:hypothetical protein ACJMK2_026039 [Sinanodonta woodiana]|uniref:Ig-like domain-containing protein n=1 Tax=Sinanodonta woodiana TaxID=1069815 RepID=A0ABD3XLX6_SINWO
MGRLCVMIIWLSIFNAMGDANRVEDVVSIPGCNTTLEWILASTYKEAFVHSITVINADGLNIAEKKEMTCQNVIDSSMYCEVRNTSNKEWRFILVLYNITQASSGNYTGQIKYGPRTEINSTIQLKVIEKPKITEVQKSILHEQLRITCSVEGEFKNLSYYWKLNGTYLNSTDRMDTSSSNFTYVNLTLADKWNILSCVACSDSNCCMESEIYVPDPYYGPESVTLSVNDSDIYIHANETFKMNCSAKCNPLCSFVWNGYVSNQNEELLINNFDSRMAGTYSCITTNTKTGVTMKSKNITLHYVQDLYGTSSSLGEKGDSLLNLLGIGLFSAAVPLVIVGVYLLHKNRRKYASRAIDSENYGRSYGKERASDNRSTHLRQSPNEDRSKIWGSENHGTYTWSHDLRTTRENAGQNIQEDKYSTIDEGVLSVYDYATENVISGNSHDTRNITEHSLYDYVSPIETCRVVTADSHVTFENYITPVPDPVIPFEMCDNGELGVLGTDETNITTSSERAHSISDINVLDSDHTYITLIN